MVSYDVPRSEKAIATQLLVLQIEGELLFGQRVQMSGITGQPQESPRVPIGSLASMDLEDQQDAARGDVNQHDAMTAMRVANAHYRSRDHGR